MNRTAVCVEEAGEIFFNRLTLFVWIAHQCEDEGKIRTEHVIFCVVKFFFVMSRHIMFFWSSICKNYFTTVNVKRRFYTVV